MDNMGAPMHSHVLGGAIPADPAMANPMAMPGGGLPSMQPMMYHQILQQAMQQWAAEDSHIHESRQAALYQAVMAASAPAVALPAMPVDASMVG